MDVCAQERIAPLGRNPYANETRPVSAARSAKKTTVLTLPFFDDFSYHGHPDTAKWADYKAYVNNTMCVNPISRGVATLDGLNEYGWPYDPNVSTRLLYADSLTSQGIDLSTHTPADSIYLSFYYQPQGNGFYPEASDSLIVYFRRNTTTGAWVKIWSVAGSTLKPFQQVMLPVVQPEYFHADFRFRFVNKASMNTNDDVWNIDYVRMDAGRNMYDTAVNDVAFTTDPGFMLNDFTYMPYHQFMIDPAGELAASMETAIRNNKTNAESVGYGYIATEQVTGAPLSSNTSNTVSINQKAESKVTFPVYSNNVPTPGGFQRAVFENKYFIQGTSAVDPKQNDTIVREQKFENYLAYDDGTAEKSYYLNLFTTLPGKTAIEYRLSRKDTLLGAAIYFGRQVPMGTNKDFSIIVYKNIGMNGGSDEIAYQQDFYFPGYLQNDVFYTYRFDKPVVLEPGTFYIGTLQPAAGVSDSLYFGLDANRIGGNHLYYNVQGFWESSTVSGALMMRPIMGWIAPTNVNDAVRKEEKWEIAPNPAGNTLQLQYSFDKTTTFELTDMQGRVVLHGQAAAGKDIDISSIVPGVYFVRLQAEGTYTTPKKLVKL